MTARMTGNDITLGTLIFSGMFLEGVEAGEAITALDVCFIETDEKAYKLNSTMSTKENLTTVMALETLASGEVGRFLLKGIVKDPSLSYTAGSEIEVPSSSGQAGEVAT